MESVSLNIIIVFIVAITLSAFFSGIEIAFVSSNPVRTTLDVNRKGVLSRLLNVFYTNANMLISTLLVGNNIALVVYGIAMAALLHPVLEAITDNTALLLILETILSTLVILFIGEFIPKTIFRSSPNAMLKTFSLPLAMFYYLLYPVSWFTTAISNGLMRLFGIKIEKPAKQGFTVGDLDAYLQENIDKQEDENKEVEREVKMFQNALDFSNTHLRDCMIPRNEIVAVNIATTDRDTLCRTFNDSGMSKIVVYNTDIDNVIGYIHVSELFHPEFNWKEHLKPVVFAPETLLAKKMMRTLLTQNKSMAIVIDEFGGTAGLVTLEDLVEEIFGDIEDEHDHKRLVSRQIDDDTYEFSGRIEVDKLNEDYHLDIPESDEYQTIAGYLLYNLEMIPAAGESVELEGLRFTIMKNTASRIELVKVEKIKN